MTEGLRAKAARGELRLTLPPGLDYDDGDHVIITPDEAVREAVMCVFRRFDQLGSARQVVVSLRGDGLRLPRRDIRTGKIAWAQANYPAVHDMLIHPGYAGVFDADGSTDGREITRFVGALVACADFAKGSRFSSSGGSDDISSVRRYGNRLLSILVNRMFGTHFTDLCYGYNAFWARHLDANRTQRLPGL